MSNIDSKPAEPVIYTLQYPITLRSKDGEVLDETVELKLNRLRGGAARRVLNAQAKGPGEFAFALLCESAGISTVTFDRLDAVDVMGAVEAAAPFLGTALPAPSI